MKECEFKPGDRVAYDVKAGKATVTCYGMISMVRPNGSYVVKPDMPVAPNVKFENIRKVGGK